MRKELAREFRKAAQVAAQGADDEQALTMPSMFPQWELIDYGAGVIVMHKGKLYRSVSAHLAQTSWAPDITPALWTPIADPAEQWPAWSQPLGGHDSYKKGAQVSHNGDHWISEVDANVWEPAVSGWAKQIGG